MAEAAADSLSISPRGFIQDEKAYERPLSIREDGDAKAEMDVRESGLLFRVNLSDYLDTGLFLDHRPARAAVRAASAGLRVLNLFSYTGAFSVYAASGGADEVVSVDLSNTYLAWSRVNFELNAFQDKPHTMIKADVLEFLAEARRSSQSWDIIIADVPTFSNSTMAKKDFDVNRDWPALLGACGAVLAEKGVILFSSNSRQLKWDPSFVDMPWREISELSIRRISGTGKSIDAGWSGIPSCS